MMEDISGSLRLAMLSKNPSQTLSPVKVFAPTLSVEIALLVASRSDGSGLDMEFRVLFCLWLSRTDFLSPNNLEFF